MPHDPAPTEAISRIENGTQTEDDLLLLGRALEATHKATYPDGNRPAWVDPALNGLVNLVLDDPTSRAIWALGKWPRVEVTPVLAHAVLRGLDDADDSLAYQAFCAYRVVALTSGRWLYVKVAERATGRLKDLVDQVLEVMDHLGDRTYP